MASCSQDSQLIYIKNQSLKSVPFRKCLILQLVHLSEIHHPICEIAQRYSLLYDSKILLNPAMFYFMWY